MHQLDVKVLNIIDAWCDNEVYRTTILLILCGYETWSVTLGEECGLKIFVKRVLWAVFESQRGGGKI